MRCVLKTQMNVHAQPNIYADVLDILPAGTIINVVNRIGCWSETSDGGYIISQFLEEML